MIPTLVHRYAWPIREAIEQLLGDAAGDCDAWGIRIEGEEVVIDVVAPATGAVVVDSRGEQLKRAGVDVAFIEDGSPAQNMEEAAYAAADASNETAKSNVAAPEADETPAARVTVEEAPSIEMPQPDEASNEVEEINTPPEEPEPPRKGGPLAQRAAIACGEKGFWTFVAKKCGVTIASADEAAFWLKERCGVSSRIDFDYDEGSAANFREIDGAYRLWLEGFD